MHWPIQAVLRLSAKQAVREFMVPASQYALACFSGRLVEVDPQEWCFFVSLFNWEGAKNRLKGKVLYPPIEPHQLRLIFLD